jgi:hypothetical protein
LLVELVAGVVLVVSHVRVYPQLKMGDGGLPVLADPA